MYGSQGVRGLCKLGNIFCSHDFIICFMAHPFICYEKAYIDFKIEGECEIAQALYKRLIIFGR